MKALVNNPLQQTNFINIQNGVANVNGEIIKLQFQTHTQAMEYVQDLAGRHGLTTEQMAGLSLFVQHMYTVQW